MTTATIARWTETITLGLSTLSRGSFVWALYGRWLDTLKSFFGTPNNLEKLTDEQIIRQFHLHPKQRNILFETLIRRHQQWLIRLLLYTLGNPNEADDVGQEVFIRAFVALKQFQNKSSFRTWLRKIAMNTAFNWRRNKSTYERYSQAAVNLSLHLSEEIVPSTADALEHREVLIELLTEVPYIYREILILRYVEEMEIKEIAAALDIGLSAAKMRLKRARKEFKDLYNGMEGHE